jgi:hypothetical protein
MKIYNMNRLKNNNNYDYDNKNNIAWDVKYS